MKKIISLCLCMVMIFSLAAPVFAVESTASSETATNGIVFEESFGARNVLSGIANGDFAASIEVSAEDSEIVHSDSVTFVDSLGDEYTLSGESDGNYYIATLVSSDGTMISRLYLI